MVLRTASVDVQTVTGNITLRGLTADNLNTESAEDIVGLGSSTQFGEIDAGMGVGQILNEQLGSYPHYYWVEYSDAVNEATNWGAAVTGHAITTSISSAGGNNEWIASVDGHAAHSSDLIFDRNQGDIPDTGLESTGTAARGYGGIDSLEVTHEGTVYRWGPARYDRVPSYAYVAYMNTPGWFRMALNCQFWEMCP